MKRILKPAVKICCISSTKEAKMAIDHGASAIGLVSHMPSGPGILNDDQIHTILKSINQDISTFLLTSETSAERIIQQSNLFKTDTIQFVDTIEEDVLKHIKKALPDVNLIQVIHVIDESSIEKAIAISKFVDAILLDSGNPKARIKILGGTGQRHNWNISRVIREEIDKPLWLAGGINSSNIQEAIKVVQPYGIDLCSGVRTNQKLDPDKLKAFFTILS